MFPHDCAIRTDDPQHLPPRDVLLRHCAFCEDPPRKELIISPKGLRIVWLAEEAHRGTLSDLPRQRDGPEPFPAERMKPLLDYLIGLRDDLMATSPGAAMTDTTTPPPKPAQSAC